MEGAALHRRFHCSAISILINIFWFSRIWKKLCILEITRSNHSAAERHLLKVCR